MGLRLIPFILTFVGASIRAIQNFCRWAGCRDHNLLLRAALEGTHFFWPKTNIPPKNDLFWFFCNSPNGYAHSNCVEILCKGVWSIPKVTVPLSKPIAMRHHRCLTGVQDRPGLTMCDKAHRTPTYPPLARAPRDDITACDQVPHSDLANWSNIVCTTCRTYCCTLL